MSSDVDRANETLAFVLTHKDEFKAHFYRAYHMDCPPDVQSVQLKSSRFWDPDQLNVDIMLETHVRFWFRCPRTNEWVFRDRVHHHPIETIAHWAENFELLQFLNGKTAA